MRTRSMLTRSLCQAAPSNSLSTFLFVLTLFISHPSLAGTIVDDPLNGSTKGLGGGGEYISGGGWRSKGGLIIYDADRQISDGYFEAKMRGWSAPAQGVTKSHPLSGWELPGGFNQGFDQVVQTKSFWNWRIGLNYNPFKVLATDAGLGSTESEESRNEARVGSNSEVNDGKPHTYRIAWKGGQVSFIFDGTTLKTFSFDRFQVQYFTIGRDCHYGVTNPAPIISDVRIVDNQSSTATLTEVSPAGATGTTGVPPGRVFTVLGKSGSNDRFATGLRLVQTGKAIQRRVLPAAFDLNRLR